MLDLFQRWLTIDLNEKMGTARRQKKTAFIHYSGSHMTQQWWSYWLITVINSYLWSAETGGGISWWKRTLGSRGPKFPFVLLTPHLQHKSLGCWIWRYYENVITFTMVLIIRYNTDYWNNDCWLSSWSRISKQQRCICQLRRHKKLQSCHSMKCWVSSAHSNWTVVTNGTGLIVLFISMDLG